MILLPGLSSLTRRGRPLGGTGGTLGGTVGTGEAITEVQSSKKSDA